jgi:hypothetical protein
MYPDLLQDLASAELQAILLPPGSKIFSARGRPLPAQAGQRLDLSPGAPQLTAKIRFRQLGYD